MRRRGLAANSSRATPSLRRPPNPKTRPSSATSTGRTVVAEIPQLGNATYLFARPTDVREFLRRYATTTTRRPSPEPWQCRCRTWIYWARDAREQPEAVAYGASYPNRRAGRPHLDGGYGVTDRYVSASDVASHVFCHRAWHLSRTGAPYQNAAEQQGGIEWHEAHSAQVARTVRSRLLIAMNDLVVIPKGSLRWNFQRTSADRALIQRPPELITTSAATVFTTRPRPLW